MHVPEACVGHSRRRVDDVDATCRFEFCTLELARRNLKGGRHGLVVRGGHRRRVLVRHASHVRSRTGPEEHAVSITWHALPVISEAGDAFDAFERRKEAQRRRPEGRQTARVDVHLRLPRELVERREARDAPFGRQAHDGGPRVRVFQGVVVGRVDAVVQIAEREDDRLA